METPEWYTNKINLVAQVILFHDSCFVHWLLREHKLYSKQFLSPLCAGSCLILITLVWTWFYAFQTFISITAPPVQSVLSAEIVASHDSEKMFKRMSTAKMFDILVQVFTLLNSLQVHLTCAKGWNSTWVIFGMEHLSLKDRLGSLKFFSLEKQIYRGSD